MSRRHEPAPVSDAGGGTGSGGAPDSGPGPSGGEAGPRHAAPGRFRARFLPVELPGGDLRAGLVFLLGLTAAGPLLGLLWAAVAPRLDVAAGISGSETAFTAQADIDATFGFICLGAGVVAGVLARWRAADGGWPVPAALAGGGFAGSLLAGWIGHLVRSPGVLRKLPPHAPAYVAGLVDFKVRATGLYLVLPVTALLVLAFALWLPTALVRRANVPPPGPDEQPAPDEAFAAASAFRPAALPPAELPGDERAAAGPPRIDATAPPSQPAGPASGEPE
ncbi:hypothetical protein [Pseudofrankia inefficax]|uniref:DUF2567 domain-containing protein n=1 Tax=Pseudofrankia inefficax (strain DSM 45817 / CECT 9037 / DDB 130130 / EuI1c) TaxID=298654 RepID=E3J1B1_PSEI1|nr:hypothetical protein [Pseudofrankia inefficax]ADP80432.1 hypothetical protein FraEuI1c_2393 [Pseudofrankia inefficax]